MNRKNIIAAIWLIGLGILFLLNYIWPGILILIGLTMIVNATMREEHPVIPPPGPSAAAPAPEKVVEGVEVTPSVEKPVEAVPYDPPEAGGEPLPEVLAPEADRLYLSSHLPENCPACNAPMRANAEKLKWNADHSVECMFCGFRLTLKTD